MGEVVQRPEKNLSEFYPEIRSMIWSFSRLNLYETCPYAFYQKYILKVPGIDNFYAQSGSVMHKTLEKLLRGEVDLDTAPEFFLDKWNLMTADVKESIKDRTYENCMDYLTSLRGDELKDYKIRAVEEKLTPVINGHKFVCIIDLLIEGRTTGDLFLIDHKSHRGLFGKNGKPLKAERKTLEEYKRQLYLYCYAIPERFLYFPKKLIWNHFKTKEISVVDFDHIEYKAALKWCTDLIEKIESDSTFKCKKDYFYCHNICEYRERCEYLDGDEE